MHERDLTTIRNLAATGRQDAPDEAWEEVLRLTQASLDKQQPEPQPDPYAAVLDALNLYRANRNELRNGLIQMAARDGASESEVSHIAQEQLREQRNELRVLAWEVQQILNDVNDRLDREMAEAASVEVFEVTARVV